MLDLWNTIFEYYYMIVLFLVLWFADVQQSKKLNVLLYMQFRIFLKHMIGWLLSHDRAIYSVINPTLLNFGNL